MPRDFAAEHELVLKEALAIYVSRSKVRGQMWEETSIQREFDMICEKLNRAEYAFANGLGLEDQKAVAEMDDALLDLVNFAVFALRKIRKNS